MYLLLSVALWMAGLGGQSDTPVDPAASARPATRALTAGELSASTSRLDSSLIAGVAGRVRVNAHQSFSVTTLTGSYWLEPVLYEVNNRETGNTLPRCGVFFLKGKEKAVFLPTLGYGWTEAETCTSLEGVGFGELRSGMPRILLLYAASSPNFSTREPIVLDWDASEHRYKGNKELSTALTHKGGSATIAAMKRRIKNLEDGSR